MDIWSAITEETNRGSQQGLWFLTNRGLTTGYVVSVVVPYCYLFLMSVFILWFSYYVSDLFCKF